MNGSIRQVRFTEWKAARADRKGAIMRNFVVTCDNETGQRINREYDGIIDFINDAAGIRKMFHCTNIRAVICGKETRNFGTVADLYSYCRAYPLFP